jgi:mannose-6-phosphate isomerase
MNAKLIQQLFLLEPQYRERVWGGQKLKPADPPIGEAWVAFDQSRVREGLHAGQTMAELTSRYGGDFLGTAVAESIGSRFPLLVKLLDCADWLSVQVHPNDEQAERLVGPGESGKTEAWHFIEVEPGATILAGVKPGTTPEGLVEAIREGTILDAARRFEIHSGETVLIPSGTLHALGPGMLLYEVQQSSDTTYRVYDWERPTSAGRKLHIEECVAVTNAHSAAVLTPPPVLNGTSLAMTVSCPFFDLEVAQIGEAPLSADTAGLSFHILTVTTGSVEISRNGEHVRLGRFESVLIGGNAGEYQIHSEEGKAGILRASIPTWKL